MSSRFSGSECMHLLSGASTVSAVPQTTRGASSYKSQKSSRSPGRSVRDGFSLRYLFFIPRVVDFGTCLRCCRLLWRFSFYSVVYRIVSVSKTRHFVISWFVTGPMAKTSTCNHVSEHCTPCPTAPSSGAVGITSTQDLNLKTTLSLYRPLS